MQDSSQVLAIFLTSALGSANDRPGLCLGGNKDWLASYRAYVSSISSSNIHYLYFTISSSLMEQAQEIQKKRCLLFFSFTG